MWLFEGLLGSVWKMFIKFLEVKGFLEVAWRKVCGWCLPGIKRVSGGYKEGVWKMLKTFLKLKFLDPDFFRTQNYFFDP